jgi:enamine deaminase RidA (YjgF/YER057c/UK114 family)
MDTKTTNTVKIANPETLAKPLGLYSHVSRVRCSELVFIAGQVAVDRQGALVGGDHIEQQTRQVFANLSEALKSEALTFRNVVKLNTYLVGAANIAKFMSVRREILAELYPNGAYPPNTLVVVERLVDKSFLVEIEAIAASL